MVKLVCQPKLAAQHPILLNLTKVESGAHCGAELEQFLVLHSATIIEIGQALVAWIVTIAPTTIPASPSRQTSVANKSPFVEGKSAFVCRGGYYCSLTRRKAYFIEGRKDVVHRTLCHPRPFDIRQWHSRKKPSHLSWYLWWLHTHALHKTSRRLPLRFP